jgi:hypothetical protein
MSNQSGGSNTNWFESCNSNAECGSGLECWCGLCTKTCATDCASGNAAATCSEPPGSCTDPSKKTACAVQCGKDADCKGLGASATCVDSVCRKTSKTTTPKDGGTLTCDDRTAQVAARVQPLRDGVDLSCKTTDDCVSFPALSCQNACVSSLASKTGAAAVASQVAAIDDDVCTPFFDAGCKVLQPPCVFPGNPGCVAGKCQYVLPGGPADSGTTSCDARLQAIGDRLNTAIDALDTSCKTNDDCTRVGTDDKCWTGCDVYAVSKTAIASLAATRASVDTDLCDPFLADGCMPATFFGCPEIPAEPPRCVQGVCTNVFTTTPPEDAGLSCADRTTALHAELQPVVDAADTRCMVDDDCKVVMLVDACIESCTYSPVSQAGASSIQSELDDIAAKECPAFASAGCTVLRLPCVAPPVPTCEAGRCFIPIELTN